MDSGTQIREAARNYEEVKAKSLNGMLMLVLNIALMLALYKQQLKKEHYRDSVNEEHLPSVDPSQSILIAEIKQDNYNIFDGHHRMEKANRTGQSWIDAYQLSGEQIVPYFITKKGYESFVRYWNGKLEEQERERERDRDRIARNERT